jgi:hypothetical protein
MLAKASGINCQIRLLVILAGIAEEPNDLGKVG